MSSTAYQCEWLSFSNESSKLYLPDDSSSLCRLEAAYCGCLPIAPNKLVYPEIYPKENLYNTSNQLIKMLYNWCRNPAVFMSHRQKFFESFAFEKYSAQELVPQFLQKLNPTLK